jgi:hypothetical protein
MAQPIKRVCPGKKSPFAVSPFSVLSFQKADDRTSNRIKHCNTLGP